MLAVVSAALAACATTPTKPAAPAAPKAEPPVFALRPVTFAELPGWREADLGPALQAFKASCAVVVRRPAEQKLGRFAPYGGTVGEWGPACAAAAAVPDAAGARAFFERWFIPNAVDARADQMSKLTAYYEPVIQARRTPQPGFTEPFLARPDDLVSIDLAAFDEQQGLAGAIAEDVLKGIANDVPDPLEPVLKDKLGERLTRRFRTPVWGRLAEKRIEPYPARAALGVTSRAALAFAHPVDVYDTQVQGSARVQFDDGVQMRMAYNSQNGWRWNSIYGQLRARGDIPAANKRAVRAWMDGQTPDAVRAALDLDPSYIFFALEPIGDPTLGPKGAQGVPLTAFGSLAVDPTAHPYGALIFADAKDSGGAPFQRLLVAQDTGGAIRRGPLRGDVYWGTGDEAGAGAEKMNGPVRFWTLLPNPAAALVSDARGFRETSTGAAR